MSDSKEKVDISEEDSEDYEESHHSPEPPRKSRIVESKTSIMNRQMGQKQGNFATETDKQPMLYSELSGSGHRGGFTENPDGRWESRSFEQNFLSEESDRFDDPDDDFRNDKKLNNNLTKNIQKNNRLKSGLSSVGANYKGSSNSKSRFK